MAYVQPIYKVKLLGGPIVPAEYVYVPAAAQARRSVAAGELPFDDPDLSKQWHYHNDGSIEGMVAGADINLFEGWEVLGTKGDPVSDTHLDVYKRQVWWRCTPEGCGWRPGCGFGRTTSKHLSVRTT